MTDPLQRVRETVRLRDGIARLVFLHAGKSHVIGAEDYAVADAILALPRPAPGGENEVSYQGRVGLWMIACFGDDITNDRAERGFRFLEEAVELAQANGATRGEAHRLVDYTFDRPVGEVKQEVGGVAVTLAALCNQAGVDMEACAEAELARVWTKIDKIRAKHASKPKDVRCALPGVVS